MDGVTYARVPELALLAAKGGRTASTTVLLGSWLTVVERADDGWLRVRAFGKEGWVRERDTGPDTTLKLFFVDVGQGDAILGECPGRRFVVDGGAGSSFVDYLTSWKYAWLVAEGKPIHLDAVLVTHFDEDHVDGVTRLLDDERFTIGTLYHNGIARFAAEAKRRPPQYDTDLGTTVGRGAQRRLTTTFSSLADAVALRGSGGLASGFEGFVTAAGKAAAAKRLGGMRGLVAADGLLDGFGDLQVRVLGPVPATVGPRTFPWLGDSSHTRNGHSVVLRLAWGTRTVLLGGDLNDASEDLLLRHGIGEHLPVDVMKAAHHGSSEFSTAFLAAAAPRMTVVSSGDNENYGHPQPDLLGATGRYSRGERPLIFSTELARSVTAEAIHYGLINVRTDGTALLGAQMYERPRPGDMWNSFVV